MQDKFGNLWLGTGGGGLCKYDGKSFTHFTEKEGLSNDNILSMHEDRKGNIWFATFGGGITKYDGKYFTHFAEKEGLGSMIVCIIEDNNGNIWLGLNNGGLYKFDGKSFAFYTEKQGATNKTVSCSSKDANGMLWFGTDGEGVIKYDGKSFYHFSHKEGLCDNNVRTILVEKSGSIWFGTDGGLSKFNGNSFSNYSNEDGLSSNFISSSLEDKKGNLWFGTFNDGLNKYNEPHSSNASEKRSSATFSHYSEKDGLFNNIVFSLLEDKSENLWIGSYGGGLSKYDGKTFTHFTTNEGLVNGTVFSILEEKNGNLWFGTNSGELSKYDGKSFTNFSSREGLGANAILSMLKDKKGNYWFGTSGSGVSKFDGKYFYNFTKKQGLKSNNVRCMYEDKIGNIWLGTDSGVCKYDGNRVEAFERGEKKMSDAPGDLKKINGKLVKTFTNYSTKEGLCNNLIFSIIEDKNENLWLGTYGGGVYKLVLSPSAEPVLSPSAALRTGSAEGSQQTATFTQFSEKEGLSNNFVFSILEDKNGNLWFGTCGGGVVKYDGKYFTNFTEKEGLSNNAVLSILEDKKGNLWFGTRFGLSKLANNYMARLTKIYANLNSDQPSLFKNFYYQDGFLGIGSNANAIHQDINGTIWIGANDRLTAFHPEGEADDTIPPNIQLTSLELFNENIAWANFENKKDSSLTLSNGVHFEDFDFDKVSNWYGLPQNLSLAYNNNYLTFNFIGITQKQSKKVKYKYKLEGFDDNWSVISSRTEAPFGNIPNGSYIFKVKAMNSEGYWSKDFSYAFTIRPPWQKTWWFRTLAAFFILVSLYSIYRWRTASLREGKRKLEKTVKDRTFEIVLQKDQLEEKSKALQQSYHNISLLSQIGQKITSTLDLEKILNTVYENVKSLMDAEEFGIGIYSAEEQVIDMQFSFYQSKKVIINNKVSMQDENRLAVWCGKNKKEIFINDMETEYVKYVPSLDAYKTNQSGVFILQSLLCLPLLIEDKLCGIIYVQSPNKNAYTPIQLEMFRSFATYTAVALNNAAAYKKLNVAMLEVEKLSIVASNAENTIIICNPDAELIWANDAFTHIFGYTLDEFKAEKGKTIMEVSTNPNIKNVLNECIEKRTGVSFESKNRMRNNEERWFQSTLSPVFNENNELRNIIIIDSDITERKIAELLLSQKNKEITDSITYAKRIQEAILPSDRSVKNMLPESFIIYKPKDIVAGDFYWIEKVDDLIVFAAADCTGHGVPGAMVSVVCNNALNRSLREFELKEPDKILNKTRELVIQQFEKSSDEVKDGMDISLCVLNNNTNQLQWAGANSPLWIIRNGELTEYKPNKQPIGKYPENKPFTNHLITLHKGDCIYIFTDGYLDQFGGVKGKKFKALKMRKLLLSIQDKNMNEQLSIINSTFDEWKGNKEQVDDVCVIGVSY